MSIARLCRSDILSPEARGNHPHQHSTGLGLEEAYVLFSTSNPAPIATRNTV
jgi:hypothetical protein